MGQSRRAATILAVVVVAGAPRGALAEAGGGPWDEGGGSGLAALVAGTSSPDAGERAAAVRALGESRDPAATAALVNVLQTDPVPEVRGWAVRALAELRTEASMTAVARAAAEDRDPRVRATAARLARSAAPGDAAPPAGAVAPPPLAATVTATVLPPAPIVAPPPPSRQRVPGRGLQRGGWITFGVNYGLAVLVGACLMSTGENDVIGFGWQMMLPVVGPAVAAMTYPGWEGEERALAVWFWLWSAAQATGIILLSVGYGQEAAARRSTAPGRPVQLAIAPAGPAGSPGLSVGGIF